MSEEQLSALLAKLKVDDELQEKLKGAADLEAAETIAKQAGFDVSKEDWLKYQNKQSIELSDDQLEGVAGGKDGCDNNTNKSKWTGTDRGRCCS